MFVCLIATMNFDDLSNHIGFCPLILLYAIHSCKVNSYCFYAFEFGRLISVTKPLNSFDILIRRTESIYSIPDYYFYVSRYDIMIQENVVSNE